MRPVIALSDIHGQLRVFTRLAAVQKKHPGAKVVFGGDYIDGHPDGIEVLQRVKQMVDAGDAVAIMGNHELMMLEYFDSVFNDNWVDNGGLLTLEAAVRRLNIATTSDLENRMVIKSRYANLIEWVSELPLEAKGGKLLFVHAGLDLATADPINDTPDEMKLWAREVYWYGSVPKYFGRNPLPYTLVMGHTPTCFIEGRYENNLGAEKRQTVDSPVFKVQYPGEMSRFYIDGGNHGGDEQHTGNIVVLDADTGNLIEKFED